MVSRESFTVPIKYINYIALALISVSILIDTIYVIWDIFFFVVSIWVLGWTIASLVGSIVILILYYIRIYRNLKDEYLTLGITIEVTVYMIIAWWLLWWFAFWLINVITLLSWLVYILEESGVIFRVKFKRKKSKFRF
jgi:hypothetical protein